jgi:CHAT domain
VASCDSGNVGSPVVPGASVAHALHQAGIPLVVASQFPLSKEASVPLAAAFFEGVLWGRNALVLLQQLRAELHARYTSSWHDWASLVVYEALPQSLPDQLETLRYHQAKRAIQAVLERIDMAVQIVAESLTKDSLRELDERIESALGRLPLHGQYAAECIGIRASSRKRLAQAAFTARGRRTGCWSSTPGRRNASPPSTGCSSRSNRWRSYWGRRARRDDGPRRACRRSCISTIR